MRLFIGIPLAETVAAELAAICARLRANAGHLRWAAPESWHITLQFLGNATPEQYACLAARLAGVHSPRVPVQLGELGLFDRAGIFFAGVDLTPQLASLQQRVAAATALCGFAGESRAFHPHITLARCKGKKNGGQLIALKQRLGSQPAFSRFTAQEFLLYESHLGPAGSTYEVRERFPLLR